MNELVLLKNDEAVCDSLEVAEKFHKRHDRVIRAIENLLRGLPKNEDTYFYKSYYIEEQNGQKYPKYLINRDGFSLLVMGFTGKKAARFKEDYSSISKNLENGGRTKEFKSMKMTF